MLGADRAGFQGHDRPKEASIPKWQMICASVSTVLQLHAVVNSLLPREATCRSGTVYCSPGQSDSISNPIRSIPLAWPCPSSLATAAHVRLIPDLRQ